LGLDDEFKRDLDMEQWMLSIAHADRDCYAYRDRDLYANITGVPIQPARECVDTGSDRVGGRGGLREQPGV
jgi:hypothetical protein